MSHSRQPTTTAWAVLKTPATASHVVKEHVLVIFLSLASSGVHLRSFGRRIFSTVGPLDAWRAWLCQLFAKELFCSRIETQQATARDKFKIRSRPTLTHMTSHAYLQFSTLVRDTTIEVDICYPLCRWKQTVTSRFELPDGSRRCFYVGFVWIFRTKIHTVCIRQSYNHTT